MSDRPDWSSVTAEALLDPARLMRVLASMGFDRYLGTVQRGTILWWPPPYLTKPARGLRECFGRVNRAMRDAEVHLLADDRNVTAVCSYSGSWRTANGMHLGDDLPSLGMLRWHTSYGAAAAKISRVVGMQTIPRAAPITSEKTWAEVHARMRKPSDGE